MDLVGAGQGGHRQKRNEDGAGRAGGYAFGGRCDGFDQAVAGLDLDPAFDDLGGGAVRSVVEGDAELGAAHGGHRDGRADDEAAGPLARRDAGLSATGLDRHGVIHRAVERVAT
ncbi:hypothetical protein D3C80_1132850 [compost metagenome]